MRLVAVTPSACLARSAASTLWRLLPSGAAIRERIVARGWNRGHRQVSEKMRSRVRLHILGIKEATEIIVKNHYLHRGRTMAQIAYRIEFDEVACGVILYSLPRISVTSNKFGGHGPMNLIELARLWLDPRIQRETMIDHAGQKHSLSVASNAISRSMRRIRQDWHGKYPHLPQIRACVAWADTTLHKGTIYRAANFREMGLSGGATHGDSSRPNGGRDHVHQDYLHRKRTFLYEFTKPLTHQQLTDAMDLWDSSRPKRRVRGRSLASKLDTREAVVLAK